MRSSRKHRNLVLMCIASVMAIITLLQLTRCIAKWESPYAAPPSEFGDAELAGVWLCRYVGGNEDVLVIRKDGTFMQTYRHGSTGKVLYQTPWNQWHTERFSDGRVRVHLAGGRQLVDGVELAEAEIRGNSPISFYDPFAKEGVRPQDELILNVRLTRQGELVLVHLVRGGEGAYLDFTGKAVRFTLMQHLE